MNPQPLFYEGTTYWCLAYEKQINHLGTKLGFATNATLLDLYRHYHSNYSSSEI